MIQPEQREYQDKLFTDAGLALLKHKWILVFCATGGGKTVVFIKMALGAIAKGRTVLLITESRKIFPQISKRIEDAYEINANSDIKVVQRGKVYVAMVQTLANRHKLIEQFNALGQNLIVVADEAHIGTHTKTLLKIKDALGMGFTASPDYRVAKHLPKIYKHLVMGPQPHQLVQSGHLSPYRHFERKAANVKGLEVKGGEFTESSQESVFETRQVYDGLLKDLAVTPFKKCLIFTSSIKHCSAVTDELRKNGIVCVETHSKMPSAEAKYNMGQFMYGDVNICVSVGELTKGYDFPPIDLVVLQRATMSLALYLQMIGRASRVYIGNGTPENPEKKFFTVLDYGLNVTRHLPWDFDHPWEEMWLAPKKKKKAGVSPIKMCPECDYVCHPSVMKCPNCGHIFVKPKQKEVETVLVEITRRYRELCGKKLSELTATELATYAELKNKRLLCARVATARERTEPGFVQGFGTAMGYKFGWVTNTLERMPPPDVPIDFTDYVLK